MVAPVRAEEPPTVEVSGGGEIGAHLWSAYTNTTVVLSGWLAGVPKSIREDGWRLRAGAGYWRMQGRRDVCIALPGPIPQCEVRRAKKRRTGSFADLLLGYQAGLGPLTLKVFAGGVYANQRYLVDDEDDGSPGAFTAGRVLVESWYNLTPDAFAQLDMGWTSRLDEITARGRLGYRITPQISLGPELSYWSADRERVAGRDDLIRYGGFVRYEWPAGEVSVSAGMTDGADDNGFYATLNALLRF
jgi:hypothetical protein